MKKGRPVTCWYCLCAAVYVDSAEVYNGQSHGMIYLCRPCQAWVGVHPNTDKPLGRLANRELRGAKRAAHAAFDPLWEMRMERSKCSKQTARRLGYKWLASKLEIDVEVCHIGMFDLEMCKRVKELCDEWR